MIAGLRAWGGSYAKVFPHREVTSRNAGREADPREVGMTCEDVEAIWSSVVRLYETGLHPAIGLCLRRRGKIVIERAIGHLRGNGTTAASRAPRAPLVPVRHDSIFNLFSASKSMTAMIVHHLDEREILRLDDRVADYIPEFGCKGKEVITIRQLLTHRAGIPSVSGARVDAALVSDWDRILGLIYASEPISAPGRGVAYHALTSGYVCGEIVRRVSGKDLRAYLRDEIAGPLGCETFMYGVPPERVHEVAENAFTGLPPLPPLSFMLERALGTGVREATELSNDPRFLTTIVPSGNVVGTAEEASRFFQMLLDDGVYDGTRVFEARTVRRAVAEQTHLEIDSFLGLPVRYGMGFMLGSDVLSPYGARTANAFGHLGFTNVLAWADPDRDIAVGLLTSGKPFITPGQLFWLNVPRTISHLCPRDGRTRPRKATGVSSRPPRSGSSSGTSSAAGAEAAPANGPRSVVGAAARALIERVAGRT